MIVPGNRMPFCAGMMADRQFYSFDRQAGRAAVLVLGVTQAGSGALSGAAELNTLMEALAGRQSELAALQSDIVVMLGFGAGPEIWQSGPGAASGLPIVLCQDDFFAQCGTPADGPLLIVIDRAARVAACWPATGADPAALAQAALGVVGQIGREAARDCVLPAPVLAIPGLFDAALCRDLIEGFERGANFDSFVSSMSADGKPLDKLSHDKKRRRDWLLQPGTDLHQRVLALLFGRCAPEIKRAFQCTVSHTDRVLVSRYDDTGGYFRRHRDNLGQAVAFRQFALSVNLNADYEGGHLLFPEHNDHRYRPATGGGIVFSSTLLHEAAPVTQGRRYVLLTFLHDARAEARRLAAAAAPREAQEMAVPA